MSKNVHVVPSGYGWNVEVEGGAAATHYRTQGEAIEASRSLARRNLSEHIIHDREGRVRQRDSYGLDPFPLRG